jgi:hypothetical protein
MSTDLIRYDLLVQEALRGVVRKVLTDAAREGLPGEHHFYISFRTDAPGVRVPTRMKEKFPDEMTIILQHQFWDLIVGEERFEVGLSFSNVPEHVVVPFDALTGFFDPSVQFGLKFEVQEVIEEGANDTEPTPAPAPLPVPSKPAAAKLAREAEKPRGAGSEPAEKAATKSTKAKAKDAEKTEGAATPADTKVVSIDAFRKKT